MIRKECPSYPVSIFIAGNFESALDMCRRHCDELGLCVTVTRTSYVYTRGEEAGVIVGLINYPRFPKQPDEILAIARDLGARLCEWLAQESYSIQTPQTTYWVSHRAEDNPSPTNRK